MTPSFAQASVILARFQAVLRDDCGLDPALPLVAAFSGGADSLCLLDLLADLGWQVHAAHFDHHLRPESGLDAGRAADLASRLGVPFLFGGGDVIAFARAGKVSIEDAARRLRYGFLFAAARELGAQAVCTGHTADDQAETLLMHLVRGSGLSGLKGMRVRGVLPAWDASIPLVRPLLGWTRADTSNWCQQRAVQPVEDASNADPAYTRNRIRHDLLPRLESYNPNIRQTLARTAAALSGDEEIVAAAAEKARLELVKAEEPGWAAYDLEGLRGLGEGLLRGVLRRALAGLRPGLEDIGFEDIRRAAEFARTPAASGRGELTAGLKMLIESGRFVLEWDGPAPLQERWAQLAGQGPFTLNVPGMLVLAGGWRLQAERLPDLPAGFAAARANEAFLDAELLSGDLSVRPAQAGDRIRPLGMGGKAQKLSDVWVNARVARRARGRYPVVFAGGEAVWVPGLRLAEPFRITAATRAVVHLELIKNPA